MVTRYLKKIQNVQVQEFLDKKRHTQANESHYFPVPIFRSIVCNLLLQRPSLPNRLHVVAMILQTNRKTVLTFNEEFPD